MQHRSISSSYTLFSKQGQVTIFIIVGIVILFAFAGILYFTKSSITDRFTTEGDPVIAQVPQEFIPLKVYTDTCLTQIGRRGLRIIGEQGGYIYPDLVGEYSTANPTEVDGISLEPAKIPYWHYNMQPNTALDIAFNSLRPALRAQDDPEMSIEAQLQRFVDEKLPECLDGYEPFTQQGFTIRSLSPPQTEVKVGESTINFLLNLEVDAARGEARHTLEQFYIKIPLRLKHYYEVAEEIAKAEANHSFLERQALDLITVYSGTDPNKLPPTDAVTFDVVPTAYWQEADVKEKVKGMLTSNVPLLRYLGGTNFYRYEYQQDPDAVLDLRDLYQKNYDNLIIPLEKGNDLSVNFDYFGWEPYFDMNDKGGKIEPFFSPINYQVLHLGINHYLSTYDISYPVLVTLRDPAAFDGEGYNFVFALESNIRNNEIVYEDQVLPPPIASVRNALACDESKWNTQPIRAVVVDSSSLEPLEAVQIGFSIPEQTDCMIGQTDNQGELESKYPAIYGGVASFIKEEYLTNFYPIDTYAYKQQQGIIGYAVAPYPEPVIQLHHYKPINVTVKKKTLEKCIEGLAFVGNIPGSAVLAAVPAGSLLASAAGAAGVSAAGAADITLVESATGAAAVESRRNDVCFAAGLLDSRGEPLYKYSPATLGSTHTWTFVNVPKTLAATETAIIVLKRVADTQAGVLNDDFSATIAVSGSATQEVELVPGIYEVTALMTSEIPLVIPEEERCDSALLGLIDNCFTLDQTVLEKTFVGQLQWDTQPTYITITPEQLYGSNQLTFYMLGFNPYAVPEAEHVRVMEDLQVMGQLGNFSQLLRNELEPQFR